MTTSVTNSLPPVGRGLQQGSPASVPSRVSGGSSEGEGGGQQKTAVSEAALSELGEVLWRLYTYTALTDE